MLRLSLTELACVLNYHQIIGITSVSLLPVEAFVDLSPRFFLGVLQVSLKLVD